MDYTLTHNAKADIERIRDFVLEDSVANALMLMERFEDEFKRISKNPEIGFRCDDLLPGVRCKKVFLFLIYYRVESSRVQVLRIMHGAQNRTADSFEDFPN